jgi:HD superfamily phosphodiesterase
MKRFARALSPNVGDREYMAEQQNIRKRPRLNMTEARIFRLAKHFLAVRNNEVHTRDAIRFALQLLETEETDRDVVIPAVILHDVGYDALSEDLISRAWGPQKEREITRMHEREGARIAADILKKIGYDASKTAEILEIIDGHDTRPVALSNNDRIVKDADKLTRYAKDLESWSPDFFLTAQQAAARLERSVDDWFFLAVSKEIARKELRQRRIEAEKDSIL